LASESNPRTSARGTGKFISLTDARARIRVVTIPALLPDYGLTGNNSRLWLDM
jgi:hypothetical protein